MYNLVSTISELPLLIGCKDFPNDQQGMSLIKLIQDFINDEYKFTGGQVTEAFRMAVKRELYLDGKRVDPSTFGQHLSVNIVGQVLTAYKESKRDGRSRPSGYNSLQLNAPVKKPITPAEAYEMIVELSKKGGKPPEFVPYHLCYAYLLEKNAIKPVNESKRRSNRYTMADVSPKTLAVKEWINKNLLTK